MAPSWILEATEHCRISCMLVQGQKQQATCLPVLWLLLLTMPLEAGHGPHFCKALAGHSSDWAL